MATSRPRRECFITIGATASFTPLLTTTLSPSFLQTLSSLFYTHLTLQCGPDLSLAQDLIASLQPELESLNLEVSAFDFKKEGLGREMLRCKGGRGRDGKETEERKEGVCVCHAGAGTILDALRLSIPLIVVPNPSLLDNHQAELADELARLGYVVHGRLDDLSAALREVEEKCEMKKGWAGEGGDGERRGDLMNVVDEELGYKGYKGYQMDRERRREERVREILD